MHWLKRWEDLVVWLPVAAVATYIGYLLIPVIDPRAGIDGWGDLWAALIAGFKGVLATFAAWRCKAVYGHDPTDDDEAALFALTLSPDPRRALTALATRLLDRLELAAWLALWVSLLF